MVGFHRGRETSGIRFPWIPGACQTRRTDLAPGQSVLSRAQASCSLVILHTGGTSLQIRNLRIHGDWRRNLRVAASQSVTKTATAATASSVPEPRRGGKHEQNSGGRAA